MSKTFLLLAAALLSGWMQGAAALAAEPGGTAGPVAETDLRVLLDTLRANRKALIAVNLDLTDAQAAEFWPLYDRYRKEISAIGDRILAIVEDYQAHFRDLSNEKALQLIRDYLDAEAERLKVRRAWLDEFAKVLPGRTVARFYQIENKMDAILQYDLAAAIPVVEPDGATPAK